MKEYFDKVIEWAKGNKVIAGVIGAGVLFFLFKMLKKKTYTRRRRRLPRSVGMRRIGRPVRRRTSANRVIKSGRNRGKKAWQIKGSEAARRHMANIRRRRSRKLF